MMFKTSASISNSFPQSFVLGYCSIMQPMMIHISFLYLFILYFLFSTISEKMTEKVAFITGISGFVGAHLAARLIGGNVEVVGLQHDLKKQSYLDLLGLRDSVSLVTGSITDKQLLHRTIVDYRPDWVFHLAAVSLVAKAVQYPTYTYETNAFGTIALLEACRLAGYTPKAIVSASTDKTYGEGLSARESDPLKGEGIYESSKVCMDAVSRSYYYAYDLPVVVTRSCNIYGLDPYNSRIVPNTIKAILHGEPPVIFSGEDSVREYIYVNDACDAYVNIAKNIDRTEGLALNVGTGEIITQGELVLEIISVGEALMGAELEPVYVPRGTHGTKQLKEIAKQSLDSQRIADLLGWQPTFDLDSGLKATFEEFLVLDKMEGLK